MATKMITTIASLLLLSVCWFQVGHAFQLGMSSIPGLMGQEQKQQGPIFVLAGLMKDPHLMIPDTLDFIVNMTCAHNVQVHIVLAKGDHALRRAYDKRAGQLFPQEEGESRRTQCATLTIELEPLGLNRNRLDRLSELREFQKAQIQNMMGVNANNGDDYDSSVIILIDMDLGYFPSTRDVMKHAERMSSNMSYADVLCANGEVGRGYRAKGAYYDTLATVLLPDTFTHPLMLRMTSSVAREEDGAFIVSKNGSFNRTHLFQWFEEQGRAGGQDHQDEEDGQHNIVEMRPVPVRSCFGGLALYRASKFFDKSCTYSSKIFPPEHENKYKNRKNKRVCEHILWNRCMKDKDDNFRIAVQPDLVTTYRILNGPEFNKTESQLNVDSYVMQKRMKKGKVVLKTPLEKVLYEEEAKGKVIVERESDEEKEARLKLDRDDVKNDVTQSVPVRDGNHVHNNIIDADDDGDAIEDLDDYFLETDKVIDDSGNADLLKLRGVTKNSPADVLSDDGDDDDGDGDGDDANASENEDDDLLKPRRNNNRNVRGRISFRDDINIGNDNDENEDSEDIILSLSGGGSDVEYYPLAWHDSYVEMRFAAIIQCTFVILLIGMISKRKTWGFQHCMPHGKEKPRTKTLSK